MKNKSIILFSIFCTSNLRSVFDQRKVNVLVTGLQDLYEQERSPDKLSDLWSLSEIMFFNKFEDNISEEDKIEIINRFHEYKDSTRAQNYLNAAKDSLALYLSYTKAFDYTQALSFVDGFDLTKIRLSLGPEKKSQKTSKSDQQNKLTKKNILIGAGIFLGIATIIGGLYYWYKKRQTKKAKQMPNKAKEALQNSEMEQTITQS